MDSSEPCNSASGNPAFAWLAEAKRYLLGANVLRSSEDYRHGPLLVTPTLHLTAHGIELFLKGALIRNGATEPEARKHGHDIMELWNAPANVATQRDVLAAAADEWAAAASDTRWLDNFDELPGVPLGEYLRRLSKLHTRGSDFALRYTTGRSPEMVGPKPHLLSATFYRVVDRYLHDMANASK